jgi:beta-lactamase superfamily II metal-dependent hydrolase
MALKVNVKKKKEAPTVKVRMYNVGFGDAFLVLLPDGNNRARKVLFDCGSIAASPEGGAMAKIVERIVEDATDDDGVARIDVVVGTHRHKDHVSGFSNAAWDHVEVQEVWMPWTEHPTDAEARRIRDIQSRMALALQSAAMAAAGSQADTVRWQPLVDNALMLSNDKAMRTLHGGFAGNAKRRFLPAKEERSFDTDAIPGVRVHVLGPSRSQDVIRDMDPPKGESFLRMKGVAASAGGVPPAPFSAEFVDERRTLQDYINEKDRGEIRTAHALSDLAVAVALDKAVNGTSLMIILEVAGTYLLFPGDAQWGSWSIVLQDAEWRDMLERLSFYKIGHHGSHNATPVSFVKRLLPVGCCAMASTLVRTIWPEIPRKPLLTELVTKKAEVARSDEPRAGGAFRIDRNVVEARIPL